MTDESSLFKKCVSDIYLVPFFVACAFVILLLWERLRRIDLSKNDQIKFKKIKSNFITARVWVCFIRNLNFRIVIWTVRKCSKSKPLISMNLLHNYISARESSRVECVCVIVGENGLINVNNSNSKGCDLIRYDVIWNKL